MCSSYIKLLSVLYISAKFHEGSPYMWGRSGAYTENPAVIKRYIYPI